MKVFFSTVIRGAPLKTGGKLVKLDWDSKMVEKAIPIYPTKVTHDPNPRGNSRGGRGIEIFGEQVVVASYHNLQLLDLDLNPQQKIFHPLMAGLHETYPGPDHRLWLTATEIDAALEIDLDTGQLIDQFWPREMPGLQQALGLKPMQIDKNADNSTQFLDGRHRQDKSHLHFNAITQWQGEIYALFHDFGVIANLTQDKVIIQDPSLQRAHNLIILADGTTFVNNSFGRAIHLYDIHTGKRKKVIPLTQFKWVQKLARRHYFGYAIKRALNQVKIRGFPSARPVFGRGLDLVGDHLFVGISPASILCIDWQRGKLVDAYCHSQDVRHTIHGLKVLA